MWINSLFLCIAEYYSLAPRSTIAKSYDSFTYSFLRHSLNVFQSSGTIFHSHRQHMNDRISLLLCQHSVVSPFSVLAILIPHCRFSLPAVDMNTWWWRAGWPLGRLMPLPWSTLRVPSFAHHYFCTISGNITTVEKENNFLLSLWKQFLPKRPPENSYLGDP